MREIETETFKRSSNLYDNHDMSTFKKVLMIQIKVLFGFIMNTSLKQCRKGTLNAFGYSLAVQDTHCCVVV